MINILKGFAQPLVYTVILALAVSKASREIGATSQNQKIRGIDGKDLRISFKEGDLVIGSEGEIWGVRFIGNNPDGVKMSEFGVDSQERMVIKFGSQFLIRGNALSFRCKNSEVSLKSNAADGHFKISVADSMKRKSSSFIFSKEGNASFVSFSNNRCFSLLRTHSQVGSEMTFFSNYIKQKKKKNCIAVFGSGKRGNFLTMADNYGFSESLGALDKDKEAGLFIGRKMRTAFAKSNRILFWGYDGSNRRIQFSKGGR